MNNGVSLEIKFATNKLQKQFEQSALAIKAYGDEIGKAYISRVNTLKHAKNFEDLYLIPQLKFHPLKGNRKGQFAVNLSGFWRLIISNDGTITDIAKIEEVSKHYDD